MEIEVTRHNAEQGAVGGAEVLFRFPPDFSDTQ